MNLGLHLEHSFDEVENIKRLESDGFLFELVLLDSIDVNDAIYKTKEQIEL